MNLRPLLDEAEERGCIDLVLRVIAEFNKRDSEKGWVSHEAKAGKPVARSTDEAAGTGCATR